MQAIIRWTGLSLLLLLLLNCSESIDSSDADNPLPYDPVSAQFKPDAINIGSISSLESRRNAALLAVSQVNAVGGLLNRPYNLVALVARSKEEAASQAEAMIAADIPVIKVSSSSPVLAVAPLTITSETLLISESATSPALTSLVDNDFVFRLSPSDIYQGQLLAELAFDAGKRRAIAIYSEGDSFGDNLSALFETSFVALGGEYLGRIAVPQNIEAGFDNYLSPLFSGEPDVVLNIMLRPKAIALLNEAPPYHFAGLYLLADTLAGNQLFIDNIVDLTSVDGAQGGSAGFGLDSNLEFQYFKSEYLRQFGLAPQAFNAVAYDYPLIVALAIEHAALALGGQLPSARQIRDSLRSVMNPPGIKIGPTRLAEALQLVRSGIDIDYSGAYSATDWDANGDVIGSLVYNVFTFDAASKSWQSGQQTVIQVDP